MAVGTHSGGMEYVWSRSARGPVELNRNMSKLSMMVSVVPLRVISTAAVDGSAVGDACPEWYATGAAVVVADAGVRFGPVDPVANPRDSAEP